MKKEWLDFVPEHDRKMALTDPAYRAALEKSAAGEMAKLRAAVWPLGEPGRRLVEHLDRYISSRRNAALDRQYREQEALLEREAANERARADREFAKRPR